MNFSFTPAKPERIAKAFNLALFALREQAMNDANYYIPIDQGILRDSSKTDVDGLTLHLSWDTPYAKRVYYTGTPSKDVNPNASLMWAHKAKDAHSGDWERILQKGLKQNL